LNQPAVITKLFLAENEHIDKYLSSWGASLKASYQGGRTKPLKYSTEHPILLDAALRSLLKSQVPITCLCMMRNNEIA